MFWCDKLISKNSAKNFWQTSILSMALNSLQAGLRTRSIFISSSSSSSACFSNSSSSSSLSSSSNSRSAKIYQVFWSSENKVIDLAKHACSKITRSNLCSNSCYNKHMSLPLARQYVCCEFAVKTKIKK